MTATAFLKATQIPGTGGHNPAPRTGRVPLLTRCHPQLQPQRGSEQPNFSSSRHRRSPQPTGGLADFLPHLSQQQISATDTQRCQSVPAAPGAAPAPSWFWISPGGEINPVHPTRASQCGRFALGCSREQLLQGPGAKKPCPHGGAGISPSPCSSSAARGSGSSRGFPQKGEAGTELPEVSPAVLPPSRMPGRGGTDGTFPSCKRSPKAAPGVAGAAHTSPPADSAASAPSVWPRLWQHSPCQT